MVHDPRACLSDALTSAESIGDFCENKTFEEFRTDKLLRSAVERQFMIIGEAFVQLSRLDTTLADQIPERARIVAFRNILVHGYAVVDVDQVWSAVTTHLPPLRTVLRNLLKET